ncbi:MAG TPA: hypothetical protein VGW11_09610 [Solirubrobacteraceae bacterium]|nr:hypothetical protein [Solirubrobacteraceae bacterium]
MGLHGNRSGGNLGPLPLGAMRLHRGAAAGVTVKLVPAGAKLEVRVAGPTVTPGYLGNADATARAFDEDGYYRTGDAVRLVREDDPAEGLMFDGRLAEDFKLDTGPWVSVTQLRSTLVSRSGGLLTDAVIAGHDRAYVSAMAWINGAEAQRLCGSHDVALDNPRLSEHLANALFSNAALRRSHDSTPTRSTRR